MAISEHDIPQTDLPPVPPPDAPEDLSPQAAEDLTERRPEPELPAEEGAPAPDAAQAAAEETEAVAADAEIPGKEDGPDAPAPARRRKHAFPRLPIPERAATWLGRLIFWLSPILAFFLVEILNYADSLSPLSTLQIALNLPFYYIPLFLFYFLRGRRVDRAVRWSLGLCWGIGMVNHYLLRFRGRALFPADLLTLRTAANVAGNYDYYLDSRQLCSLLVVAAVFAALALLPLNREKKKRTWRTRLAAGTAALCSVGFLVLLFGTSFANDHGIATELWTTRGNGFFLNFSLCLKDSRVAKPEGYSAQALDAIAQDIQVPTAGEGRPNVIVIMNEAFSDLTVLPGVESNQDAIPFFRSLTENTVKGYAYASVFGGTTANSEYEFLTGNTTAFLPAGSVPYQMYVYESATSLVGQMNDLGYRTVAMHPFYASGWNRPGVYGHFGFDETYFVDSMQDLVWVRDYVSDRSNYQNLIRIFEEKEAGEPLFFFNVTMQNHSAYRSEWFNLDRDTWLTGEYGGRFSTVDQYLSLMRESDRALQELIEYFQTVDEPTVICLFGDHQPQVATNFYTDVLGAEPDLATAQKKQMVPFLIWANYDIEEQDGLELSLNYLSSLLTETAGLPQTKYQAFLSRLREALPIINALGIRDGEGTWYPGAATLPEELRARILPYEMLQYSDIFGVKDRPDAFFTLPE